MAEAAAAVQQHRFFCHSCKGEVSPKLPEYTCPRCESGFIEEVTDDSSIHKEKTFFPLKKIKLLIFLVFRQFLLFLPFIFSHHLFPHELTLPSFPRIIQQIFAGFFANSAIPGSQHPFSWSGMLHSSPGDYAWGQSGLDAIVTQVSAAATSPAKITSFTHVPTQQEVFGSPPLGTKSANQDFPSQKKAFSELISHLIHPKLLPPFPSSKDELGMGIHWEWGFIEKGNSLGKGIHWEREFTEKGNSLRKGINWEREFIN
uniref:RING-type E3 ubiquitin transferase n=1 Tax=Junco hyemalis TaxID=40217 RepID=A0A8C5IWU2_JUNHY